MPDSTTLTAIPASLHAFNWLAVNTQVMPFVAGFFGAPTLIVHVRCIVFGGAEEEMVWIYTRRVIAAVADEETLRYFTDIHLIGDSMGKEVTDSTVALG